MYEIGYQRAKKNAKSPPRGTWRRCLYSTAAPSLALLSRVKQITCQLENPSHERNAADISTLGCTKDVLSA